MDRPPDGKLERAANAVKSLSLTNILILALIVVIAVPAYFSYRFMTDTEFRREFMMSADIVDKYVPCTVLEGHRYGSQRRHSVFVVYGVDGRMEKLVGMRAPETLTDAQISNLCERVVALADKVKEFDK